MDDNGVIRKLVEMGDGGDEGAGGSGDGDELSGPGRVVGRQERVGILTDGLNLYREELLAIMKQHSPPRP